MLFSRSSADYNAESNLRTTTSLCPVGFTGFLVASSDCKKYVSCLDGELKDEIICPEGQLYDMEKEGCVDESSAHCRGIVVNNENTAAQIDIVSDELCSTVITGLQGLPDCLGFAVCDEGFMVQLVQCDEGSMYDASVEDCSVEKTECGPVKTESTDTQVKTTATTDEPAGKVTATDEPTEKVTANESTGKFYPNWASKKCDEKNSNHPGLGLHYDYYDNLVACCSRNFISSIDQLESCIGSTLEEFFGGESAEQLPEDSGFIPNWGSNSCVVQKVEGASAQWMKDTLRSKKWECCFEYLSWDLFNCMS